MAYSSSDLNVAGASYTTWGEDMLLWAGIWLPFLKKLVGLETST